MSRANMQALILLSSFSGCLGTLINRNCYARVDVKRRISETFDQSCLAINQWPFDNNDSLETALEKIHDWGEAIGTRDIPANVLVYIASRILSDLEDRLKNRWKREQVRKLREMFQPIEDFADPDRVNWNAYDEGEKLMSYLDKLLEE